MKKYIPFILLLIITACSKPEPQKAAVIGIEDIASLTSNYPDKIQVINFWATWCKPCVDELPAFEKLKATYGDQIEVILISLDDVENLESKVNPFLEKHNIQSQVRLLDYPYAAEYIPMVDPHWDGAIPVTLIKYKKEHKFYNQSFEFKELDFEVAALLEK
ncbi:TlpA disulfide reductase family protein [Nonlabens ulvanivorans]|uniref:TlpA disulfide reductase family protein n=1 Tax=Nonlabens ulvanivorans TaxID=906888 RepID=UPI0037C81762